MINHLEFIDDNIEIGNSLHVHYDIGLVFLSVFIAIFSSYIAILVARHIRRGKKQEFGFLWHWAGAIVLGGGIWSMHFIGMLAYQLPGFVNYDISLTILSIIPAILSGYFLLKTTKDCEITVPFVLWRSLLIGGGIGLMHYTGMASMHGYGIMLFDLWLFILSFLVAVVLAGIAFHFKLQADKVNDNVVFSFDLLIPAVMMGGAISAMHYIGMASMFVFAGQNKHLPTLVWSADDLVIIISSISLLVGLALLITIELSYRLDLYRKVKLSEENLAITLNSIGDAVISTDVQGRVIFMNPIAEQLTGWTQNASNGKHLSTVFNIVDTSSRKDLFTPIDKVLRTGETVYLSNSTTLIGKDGTEHQIADSAAPIRNSDNEIVGMVLVFNDVTEQYKLREEAAISKRNLQAIMDNSPAVIYAKDLEGRYIFINKVFEKLFSILPNDIIGKTNLQVFPKEIADDFSANDEAVLEAGVAKESEQVTPHEDGLHTYLTVKFPLLDENDNAYAVCGISTDITERKEHEEKLRQSQKMDALGKLTGGIAHDYNNMLGIILGYTSLMEDMVVDQPKLVGYVKEIRRAGERGAVLTKKLLAFTSNKSANEIVVNINLLVKEEQNILEKTLTARIKLVLDLTDNVWPVYLDKGDLEDAIVNMSINAMHAIEVNGQLTIQTRNEFINDEDASLLQIDSGDYVLLSMIDTGCGMDQKTMAKVFDPFYSTKGEMGTGLGLSQVYGFVTRSGAAVKVFSELDKGSRFTLYFPRYDKESLKNPNVNESHTGNIKGNAKILVVDDEIALIELTSEILRNNGYQVMSASSAQQALNILEKETFDLLLSDVIMPDMGGYELASIVKEKYPDVKIQLASGFSGECPSAELGSALHTALLTKPYNSQTLLERLRELLD